MDKPVKRIIKAIQTLMQVHGGLANEAELENALNEHIREQVFDVLSLAAAKATISVDEMRKMYQKENI